MADPVTVRVGADGSVEYDGQTYTFPSTLAGALVTLGGVPEPPAPPEEDASPSQSAPKSAWVDYAVEHHGADRDTAEGLTKQDLIAAYAGGS